MTKYLHRIQQESQSMLLLTVDRDIWTLFRIFQTDVTLHQRTLAAAQQAHRKRSTQRNDNLLRDGILSVLCGGVCGFDNSIACSPSRVCAPSPNKYTNTPAHNTYPTMQKLITTSVIFSEENQIMRVLCGDLSGVYFADLHQIALHCTPLHTGCTSQH